MFSRELLCRRFGFCCQKETKEQHGKEICAQTQELFALRTSHGWEQKTIRRHLGTAFLYWESSVLLCVCGSCSAHLHGNYRYSLQNLMAGHSVHNAYQYFLTFCCFCRMTMGQRILATSFYQMSGGCNLSCSYLPFYVQKKLS